MILQSFDFANCPSLRCMCRRDCEKLNFLLFFRTILTKPSMLVQFIWILQVVNEKDCFLYFETVFVFIVSCQPNRTLQLQISFTETSQIEIDATDEASMGGKNSKRKNKRVSALVSLFFYNTDSDRI